MAIRVQREVLAEMLRSHGEDELAERLASLSDDERARIGRVGAYYAWSEDAMKLGISLGGARALSLAAIDVLEKPDEGSVATSRMPSAPKATQNSRQSAGELENWTFDVKAQRNSTPGKPLSETGQSEPTISRTRTAQCGPS